MNKTEALGRARDAKQVATRLWSYRVTYFFQSSCCCALKGLRVLLTQCWNTDEYFRSVSEALLLGFGWKAIRRFAVVITYHTVVVQTSLDLSCYLCPSLYLLYTMADATRSTKRKIATEDEEGAAALRQQQHQRRRLLTVDSLPSGVVFRLVSFCDFPWRCV